MSISSKEKVRNTLIGNGANLRSQVKVKGQLQEIYRQQHQTLYQLTSSMSEREKLRAAMVINTCGLALLYRVLMVNSEVAEVLLFAATDDAHIADGLLDPQSKFNTGIAP